MLSRRNQSRRRRAPPRRRAAKIGRSSDSLALRATQPKFTVCRLLAGQIVPDKLIVPMKYVNVVQMNGAAGVSSWAFSLNSVYDPDVTGTGSSVQGFSSLSALYGRYRVISTTIRVTLQTGGHTGNLSAAIAPTVANFGSAATALAVGQSRHAKPRAIRMAPSNGYGPPIILDDAVSISEMVGHALYDAEEYFGIGSADPTNQLYWMLGTNDNLGLAYSLAPTVEIEYVTEWSLARDAPS